MQVAPGSPVAKKQQIKLSPVRSGRRIRWTFEVSADVDAEKRGRAKKPAQKPKRRRPAAKAAPVVAAEPAVEAARAVAQPAVVAQQAVVPAPVIQPAAPWQPTRGQMGVVAGAAVLVIATLAVPGQRPASYTAPPQPEWEERVVDTAIPTPKPSSPTSTATSARPVVKVRALGEAPKKTSVQSVRPRTVEPARPTSPTANAMNAAAPIAAKPAPKLPVPEPTAPSLAPAATADPVTITGCLEMSTDGAEFRLADTEGADAPKSRSWRTGFLRKRTAPVALIGAPDPLALQKNVGRRVVATGLLTSRELQVSSLRVVGPSCN